ncbi:MAG: hypothetical protein NZ870_03695, partial [bacterium]|nr:hypothetical protein [bacterium]
GAKYQIRFSTDASNGWNSQNIVEISTSGVAPTTRVSTTITGLSGGNTYYFWIRTIDDFGNISGISNTATTYAMPVVLSLSVSTGLLNFGVLSVNFSTTSHSSIDVVNNGNVPIRYALKASTNGICSIGETNGIDRFVLYAVFHSVRPSTSSFSNDDAVLYFTKQASNSVFSVDGSQTGTNVPIGSIRNLWLGILTPTSTSTIDEQVIMLTILAAEE